MSSIRADISNFSDIAIASYIRGAPTHKTLLACIFTSMLMITSTLLEAKRYCASFFALSLGGRNWEKYAKLLSLININHLSMLLSMFKYIYSTWAFGSKIIKRTLTVLWNILYTKISVEYPSFLTSYVLHLTCILTDDGCVSCMSVRGVIRVQALCLLRLAVVSRVEQLAQYIRSLGNTESTSFKLKSVLQMFCITYSNTF